MKIVLRHHCLSLTSRFRVLCVNRPSWSLQDGIRLRFGMTEKEEDQDADTITPGECFEQI